MTIIHWNESVLLFQQHASGISGSTMGDMKDIVRLIGGKKLIYTHIDLPLTAIADFAALGETDDRFKTLDTLVKKNNGLRASSDEGAVCRTG